MDNKPPPRAWQWSTFSHSVCFLDLTTLLLIRFRHLYQFPFPFNQTMIKVSVQPLYSMAPSTAHDFFCQEANTLSSFCVLMSKGVMSLGRHTRPACNQGLLEIYLKRWFWPQYSAFFMDFRWCEGSGASFHGLRMRSMSTRKCAHKNAGDLGSNLAVCACAYDPIHVTAQGKSLGSNCACVLPPRN